MSVSVTEKSLDTTYDLRLLPNVVRDAILTLQGNKEQPLKGNHK